MRVHEWSNIVRALRRLHGLSRAQFASMIPVPADAVARWEEGQEVPAAPAQAILRDMLSGHFHSHPTFLGIKAMVRATQQLSALYTPGMVVHALSRPLEGLFAEHRFDVLGTSMLPRIAGRSSEMVETYVLPMLEGRSDILSLSFIDRGVADRTLILRQQLTIIPLDGIRVLATVGIPLHRSDDPDLPDADLRILTADDLRG
ncbi:helix-turn-helix domain-containing protein [Azospirillum thermophilum]|uniref:HTH cro/C1-type domain-containing protein n=1 Tax=Azospirillum thermophilum TaxID=2202148 RepID=A0A2S2CQT4_9PROT|nr:hypothetical protein [Azospirillum thermophilum]AWK86871.1 hypothetical protein DEW08_12090 [Azospirillum thermophilum]